ncbi:MAG TPA: tetratricopeptide repeat protein [Terriglobia bacterium]|nr:tetratricopeptide repeat protein [Terriglobia bacterium]
MECPHCHASNPDSSFRCAQCGVTFDSVYDAATLGGLSGSATPASPTAAPSVREPGAAIGVASPTPGAGSRPLSGSVSWVMPTGQVMRLEAGSEFGPRYRIEGLLGQGGMGAVYKAYDKDLDRTVALKLVRPDLVASPATMQRFKQELLLSRKISQKNVLRIHDLGDVDGVKFISMAYVEGDDLHRVIEGHGRLPVERAVSIARQLCAALEAAQAEGVVHRDLKPQNVLVDQDDNAYVSDFGLAKSLEAGSAMMTNTGDLLGTPRYMSPEQVEGKPADHRSDLYSLGLIFYEMVTGEVPFKGDSALQVMYARTKEKPKSPKLLNPDLPDYLVRIILRCLERDPADRYQNAREIAHDLDAEYGPSLSRSVRISVEIPAKHGWLFAAGGALVLLAILALAIPTTRNFILRRPQASTVAPSPGIPSLAQGKYIAVLPFRVLGDAEQLGYIAEGLGDALSTKLFQLKNIHVASPGALDKTGPQESAQKIARQLGANLVVQGTLQSGGGKIAIIVSLVDAASGQRLWTNEFSGVSQDLLTLEDEIYTQLVGALELKPGYVEQARAAMHPTENTAAYDLYLKGKQAMRGQQNLDNVTKAIEYYNDALQRDPNFALAYAGLADASLAMYRDKKDSFWSDKALAAAEQAQQLNNGLAEVHFALGSVYGTTGKTNEAILELDRAITLDPRSDEAYRRLGGAYLNKGRKDEAIEAYHKAVQLNPYYWLNYNALGEAYLQTGDNEKALAMFSKVTELEPDNVWGYENIGAVYLTEGEYDKCIPVFQKALQLQPTDVIYSNLGTAYFYLKRYSDAVPMFEKAVQLNPNDETDMGNLADAYRGAGQKDKASATYDKAIALAYKELAVNPRKADTMDHLALYYSKKGETTQALQFIHRAREIDGSNVEPIYDEATIQTAAGHTQEALKALREAFQRGYSPRQAANDPELKSLQGNPEFAELIKEFSDKPQ